MSAKSQRPGGIPILAATRSRGLHLLGPMPFGMRSGIRQRARMQCPPIVDAIGDPVYQCRWEVGTGDANHVAPGDGIRKPLGGDKVETERARVPDRKVLCRQRVAQTARGTLDVVYPQMATRRQGEIRTMLTGSDAPRLARACRVTLTCNGRRLHGAYREIIPRIDLKSREIKRLPAPSQRTRNPLTNTTQDMGRRSPMRIAA